MKIELEHVNDSAIPNTFRVAFHSASERCLLPYPSVTGLTFTDSTGNAAADWKTRYLVSQPLDDFVMSCGARIAFDLHANINDVDKEHRWNIELPVGSYNVRFDYAVERETDWYDFLAKRSRFAAATPIWRGAIQSNTIQFSVSDSDSGRVK